MAAEQSGFLGKGGQLGWVPITTTPITTTTAYTYSANVKTFSPKRPNGEVENTLLGSTFTPYLCTIGEGSADLTFNYCPGAADTAEFLSLIQSGSSAYWAFKTAAGSLIQFEGFFTDFSIEFSNKEVVDASATIRWTADAIFTPASS